MNSPDRKRKNTRLFLVLFLLLGALLILVFWEPARQGHKLPEELFVVHLSQEIDKIILSRSEGRSEIVKQGNEWKLNDKWKADPDMMILFFEILDRNRVQRQVASSLEDQVDSLLNGSGTEVRIFKNEEEVLAFQIGGYPSQNRTYAKVLSQDRTYELYIPGYNYFIGRVFLLAQNQWRDRRVFTSTWRSLKKLTIDYPHDVEDGFTIEYEIDHLSIGGIKDLDTLKMMNYLDLFSSLRVVEFVEKEDYTKYQSQVESPWIFGVRIDDIDTDRNNQIRIFTRPNAQSAYVGETKGGELVLFDPELVEQLMRPKEYFRAQSIKG